jgi:hypothetical protein
VEETESQEQECCQLAPGIPLMEKALPVEIMKS